MSLVRGIDLFDPVQDFGVILKRQDPLAGRQPIAQAGVLDQDWQTRSEITDTSVTEPAGSHLDVTMFGHSKLCAGLLDKLAISLRGAGDKFARDYFPPMIGQIRRPVQRDAK